MDKKAKSRRNSWILFFLIAATTLVLAGVFKYYLTEPPEMTPAAIEQMEQAKGAAVLPVCICLGLDVVWILLLIKVRGIITFFNRRELICTFDTAKQAEIRKRLAENGIRYKVQMAGSGTGGAGRSGYDVARLRKPEFIIYVHKKDFEKASCAVNTGI